MGIGDGGDSHGEVIKRIEGFATGVGVTTVGGG